MVNLGIEIYIADKVEEEGVWFDMDDRSQWSLAWECLYNENGNGDQGTILSYGSDYFKELEISETTELNDIYMKHITLWINYQKQKEILPVIFMTVGNGRTA